MMNTSDVRGAIDRVNRTFVDAYNRGDAGGVAAAYTDNATIMPPGSPRVSGRKGIQQFWQGAMDAGVRAVALRTDDIEVAGDMAREVGTATITMQPPSGEAQTAIAKYLVIWKRQDGEWRLHTDIWNADA
jgi:uncharacterized protein (TIGR02246 family)